MRFKFALAMAAMTSVAHGAPEPVALPSTSTALTVLHPTEGQRLPNLSQVFTFGAVSPGSTLTVNGLPITVHPGGGYLAMIPMKPGELTLTYMAMGAVGSGVAVDRRVVVSSGFVPSPINPLTLEKGTVTPTDNLWLSAGDVVRVTFQGSPGAKAEFAIEGVHDKIPMAEIGGRGQFEGTYWILPTDKCNDAKIVVTLKKGKSIIHQRAPGRITIDHGAIPRVGVITEETVAARTGPDGGYDLFLYKGMRVRLTGKIGGQWRARLSSQQSGWIKESAVQELPGGTAPAQSMLTNMTIVPSQESSLIRVPLSDMLPYRTEQSLDPMQLVITLYGAVNKTDLIKHDTTDTLIRIVRWRQIAPDTSQIIIEPRFKRWWGYDVRYEGNTLMVEVRAPWPSDEIKGMVIAVDPGHGGTEKGAAGPHELWEKDANLAIAKRVVQALEDAGAKPFLTREIDMDLALYERPKMAWQKGARLFVSVHCNSAGLYENPVFNNGFSLYWYQPQSQAFASSLHNAYKRQIKLRDHGLYYADLAVCRMTQMPAVLTEQAFIIEPEQERLLFDPKFQRSIADSIVDGIRRFVAQP